MIILLTLLLNTTIYATVNCGEHPIFCHIKKNKASVSNEYAMNLSNTIYKYSTQYNGDSRLAVAIATQETGLRNIHRKQNIIQFFEKCNNDNCAEDWRVIKGVSDVCMFQFHVNTITYYNMDPIKLKNNIEYCVEWHFKLMNIKKKLCRKMKKPWACYHSKNKQLRNIYIKFVERYL